MRELAFGNPYVRPNVSIPSAMWPIYREGYYAAICAAIRNMQSVLDARNDARRAQIKAALAKRKAARLAELATNHVGEKIGVRIDQVIEPAEQSGNCGQWKYEFKNTVVIRQPDRDAERSRLFVDHENTFHVDRSGNVDHSSEYPAAPIATQQKNPRGRSRGSTT